MLFGEIISVYYENRTEHTDTLSVHNAEIQCAKAGDTYATTALRKIKGKHHSAHKHHAV
jgi:hypothetical protein